MKKLLLILIVCCSVTAAGAQEEMKGKVFPKDQDFARFQLATSLAQYGYSTYSPTALLEAAKILSRIATEPLQYESFEQDGKAGDIPEADGFTVKQLLADAIEYADGDQATLALINSFVPVDAHRGRSGGIGSISMSINSYSTHKFGVKFESDEVAKVQITGNGSTDLDLYIYDKDESLIGKATDATDVGYVSWEHTSPEAVTIVIKNNSSAANSYEMITN